ncbi:MAG: hypothetical protein LBV33_00840, partial [Lachnospiraceae bacterium]|nr:hypothetical protein [Lachnospiraceae bacterium]
AVIYPLYIRAEGYAGIGRDKYWFYRYVTIGLLIVVAVAGLINYYTKSTGLTDGAGTEKNPIKGKDRGVTGRIKALMTTETAVATFSVVAVISYLASPYRETAWIGADGWFMGLETLLLMTLTYFYIARMVQYSDYIWPFFMVGGVVVFFLGICNRFSFYPLAFDLVAPEFISTLGNINWFAGYFSVIWPIGAGLAIFSSKRWVRITATMVTMIAFGAGVTQGSSSAFLSMFAGFGILLYACLNECDRTKLHNKISPEEGLGQEDFLNDRRSGAGNWKKYGGRLLGLAAGWCVTCQVIRVLRVIMPERYNYETDNLCGLVTSTSLSIVLLIPIVIIYVLTVINNDADAKANELKSKNVNKAGIIKFDIFRLLKQLLIALPLVGLGSYLVLLIINTMLPDGIGGFSASLFRFDQDWGYGRGMAWMTGMELFTEASLPQKLLGVGPDSFMEYLYSIPDIAGKIRTFYNNATLTNAHNEWITTLVNLGLAGTIAYIGIFVSVIGRFMRGAKENKLLYIPLACAFSYMIHNMVSFGQVLNMPFLFIIIGIGECCYRQRYPRRVVSEP